MDNCCSDPSSLSLSIYIYKQNEIDNDQKARLTEFPAEEKDPSPQNNRLCMCLQTLSHGKDMTQDQFLSGV